MNKQSKYDKKAAIKIAGAFLAYVIGAAFATGQEVLQFFTSYGYLSYAIILIALIGFLFIGQVLLITGYEHKEEKSFNHFKFFCGEKLGEFYTWLHPIVLLSLMPVLVSGAGATFSQAFGIHHYIGSAILVALILAAYLNGFERLVKLLSTTGFIVIIFLMIIAIITVFRDFDNFGQVSKYESMLAEMQSSSN